MNILKEANPYSDQKQIKEATNYMLLRVSTPKKEFTRPFSMLA